MAIAIPRISGCVFLPKDRGITPSFRSQIAWDKAPNLLRDVTPDTAKYMGLDHKQVDFPDGSRKCFLPIPHCEGCWPLKGIFILAFGDLGIQPLPMTEALGMIKAHTYRNFLVEPIWGEEAFLKEQVRLLRDVPAFLFTRPRDLNTLASMTEFLCENLAN